MLPIVTQSEKKNKRSAFLFETFHKTHILKLPSKVIYFPDGSYYLTMVTHFIAYITLSAHYRTWHFYLS